MRKNYLTPSAQFTNFISEDVMRLSSNELYDDKTDTIFWSDFSKLDID